MLVKASKLMLLIGNLHYLLATQTKFSDCSHLLGIPLEMQCIGTLTKHLSRKYRDKHAEEGIRYAVFSPDHLMLFVFITMYSSPLMSCGNLTVLDSNNFECNSLKSIKLRYSQMICFEFPLRYLAELRDNCMHTQNVGHRAIDQSALHYTDVPSVSNLETADWWLLLIMVIASW